MFAATRQRPVAEGKPLAQLRLRCAAVCGQIAGAFYGLEGIPEEWHESMVMRDHILTLADQLHDAA